MSLHLTMSVNRASTERQQSVNRASTEHQQSRVWHLVWSNGSTTAFTHNRSIGRLYRQYRECRCRCTWKWASTECQQSVNKASTEHQQSINNLECCILYNPRTILQHLPIINVSAAFMLKRETDMVSAALWEWASTEHPRFQVLHLV